VGHYKAKTPSLGEELKDECRVKKRLDFVTYTIYTGAFLEIWIWA